MNSLSTNQALRGENGVQNGILHVENEAQSDTFHVGNGYQNGSKIVWKCEHIFKINLHFSTILMLESLKEDPMVFLR